MGHRRGRAEGNLARPRRFPAADPGRPRMTAYLAAQFAQWRHYVRHRQALRQSDTDELEVHLRVPEHELVGLGPHPDEAFLVAVKRIGSLDDLSREFAREHSERLWKQLVLTGEPDSPVPDKGKRRDLLIMVICAVGAAVSVKVPELFGMRLEK